MIREDIKILCVDDSPLVHKFLKATLETSYKNLFFANDGKEGIEAFKKHHPHIIISDINMPNMKGMEMVAHIKKLDNTIPIVLMTTESDRSFVLDAAAQGVSGYVNKSEATHKIKPTIDKLVHHVIKHADDVKVTHDNPYAYLQAFLELSEELVILTDGKNIFSCNQLFLNFLQLNDLTQFVANYASAEYLVDSIEGYSEESVANKHWIQLLLKEPTGLTLNILHYKTGENVPLRARAAKIPDKNELYAVMFSTEQKDSVTKVENNRENNIKNNVIDKHEEVFEVTTLNTTYDTLSQEIFTLHFNTFIKQEDSSLTLLCIKVSHLKLDDEKLLKQIAMVVHHALKPSDILYTYNNDLAIISLKGGVDGAKLKAKNIAHKLKNTFTKQHINPKFGFVNANTTNKQKLEAYLEKFFASPPEPYIYN